MAKMIVNRGLQMIGDRASGVAGAGAAIQTMAIDDSSTAFALTHTALNSGGAVTTEADVAIAAPTRSGQTVSHVGTFAAGVGTMNIRRISLHNDTPANVSASSTTLIGGIDAQSFQKPADLELVLTVKATYSNAP